MDIEHGELPDKPAFAALAAGDDGQKVQFRRVPVPQHRLTVRSLYRAPMQITTSEPTPRTSSIAMWLVTCNPMLSPTACSR